MVYFNGGQLPQAWPSPRLNCIAIRVYNVPKEQTKVIKQSNVKQLAKLIFVLALIAFLASLVDPKELLQLLTNISLPLFFVVVLIALIDLALMGLKWNILLKTFHVRVSNYGAVMAYLRSRIFAFIAPSTLGVDTYKVYFLKKYYDCPVAPVTSSIIVERVLGLFSSLGVTSLLLWFALQPFEFEYKYSIVAVGLIGFVGLLLSIHLMIRYSRNLIEIDIPSFVPAKITYLLTLLFSNFKKIEGSERRLWLYFFLSMVEKLSYGCAIYFSALAIGLDDISFTFIIAATPLMALLERLPISFSTIGVREGLFVVLMAPFYSDTTVPISIALTLRFAELTQIGLFSFIWFVQHEEKGYEQELEAIAREMPQR
jgi:uncharacterized protein (TIRG00374 family)